MATTVSADKSAAEYLELLDDEPTMRGKTARLAELVRQHADYFVKQINKLEEIICSLK